MKSNLMSLIIINVITAILSFLLGIFSWSFFSIVNIVVFCLLRSKDEKTFLANKNIILLFSILNFLSFRIISGALCASLYSSMKKLRDYYFYNNLEVGSELPKEMKKKEIDPQIKKVDILLKLGVGMVFVAGLVFATTGWNTLNSIFKIVILLIIAGLFVGLSKFCEKKLKIKSTIYLYWVLGMAFIVFTVFTIGYSSILGNYFCFNGEGRLLYFGFCTLVISGLCILSYFNFKNKYFLPVSYVGCVLSTTFVCNQFQVSSEWLLLLLISVSTIISSLRINQNKDLYILNLFSKIMLIIFGVLFILCSSEYSNYIIVGIDSLLLIANMVKFAIYNKNSDFNYVVPFFVVIILKPLFSLIFLDDITLWALVISFILTGLYFASAALKFGKLELSALTTSNILNIVLFIAAFSGPQWLPLVVLMFSFSVSIFNYIKKTKYFMSDYIVQPIKISMFIFAIFNVIKDKLLVDNIWSYWLLLSILVFVLIYILLDDKKKVLVYEKYIIISSIISFLSISHSSNIIISVVSFLSLIVFYLEHSYKDVSSKRNKILIFSLLLFDIFIGIHSNISGVIEKLSINLNPNYISNIIVFALFAIIGLFTRKDSIKLNLVSFGLILPILSFGISLVYEWAPYIFLSMLFYYLAFNISRLIKNETIRGLISAIGYSIAFIFVIFNGHYIVLCYTCVMLLLSNILGYVSKKYNALFKVSIIFTIIFVVYQLKEFWTQIPAWLYLLVFGLVLIIFATYKQLKTMEKESTKEKEGE